MAWIDGANYSTGQLITSTIWNSYLGAAGNIDLTAPGVVTTAGDTIYATGDNTITRLPSSGESLKFLRMNAGETALEYATALADLVSDTTPQLGGYLDANSQFIGMDKGGPIASAGTTTIDTDGDYFDVTGTTTITGMTVAVNRHFFLQFDAALILTHHATDLDLPGEANITTAAGDVAEFFSHTADKVQCVNYTKADGSAVKAGGKIGKVIVSAVYSTRNDTNSNAFVNMGGPTATITPSADSSKILIMMNCTGLQPNANEAGVDFERAVTGEAAVDNISGATFGVVLNTGAGEDTPLAIFVDSPNTTAATTYTPQWRNEDGTTTIYCHNTTTASIMVLMEILA